MQEGPNDRLAVIAEKFTSQVKVSMSLYNCICQKPWSQRSKDFPHVLRELMYVFHFGGQKEWVGCSFQRRLIEMGKT